MRTIITISGKENPEPLRNKLKKYLTGKRQNKKKLSDFYGALPDTYGDGLNYQIKGRIEWI